MKLVSTSFLLFFLVVSIHAEDFIAKTTFTLVDDSSYIEKLINFPMTSISHIFHYREVYIYSAEQVIFLFGK